MGLPVHRVLKDGVECGLLAAAKGEVMQIGPALTAVDMMPFLKNFYVGLIAQRTTRHATSVETNMNPLLLPCQVFSDHTGPAPPVN